MIGLEEKTKTWEGEFVLFLKAQKISPDWPHKEWEKKVVSPWTYTYTPEYQQSTMQSKALQK